MCRNNLSFRAVTSTGQILPRDWEVKVESFGILSKNVTKEIQLKHIGNMDEVPDAFDMPRNFTVMKEDPKK
jgi:hypothetical protein